MILAFLMIVCLIKEILMVWQLQFSLFLFVCVGGGGKQEGIMDLNIANMLVENERYIRVNASH